MIGLSDGTPVTNSYKPYLVAFREIGATADIFHGMVLVGYKGRNTLISFDGLHRDWFGEIVEVTNPQDAVNKIKQ